MALLEMRGGENFTFKAQKDWHRLYSEERKQFNILTKVWSCSFLLHTFNEFKIFCQTNCYEFRRICFLISWNSVYLSELGS